MLHAAGTKWKWNDTAVNGLDRKNWRRARGHTLDQIGMKQGKSIGKHGPGRKPVHEDLVVDGVADIPELRLRLTLHGCGLQINALVTAVGRGRRVAIKRVRIKMMTVKNGSIEYRHQHGHVERGEFTAPPGGDVDRHVTRRRDRALGQAGIIALEQDRRAGALRFGNGEDIRPLESLGGIGRNLVDIPIAIARDQTQRHGISPSPGGMLQAFAVA